MIMVKIFWLEIKALSRKLIWLIFLALFSFFSFFGVANIEPSLKPLAERELYGPARMVISLGEWGRAILLVTPVVFAMSVSLLATGVFAVEMTHREPLWATPKISNLAIVGTKLISISTFVTFLITIGSLAAFFNHFNRKFWAMAGGLYIPVYFALVLVQAVFWVAMSVFLFHLARSRWAAVIIVTAMATFLSMAGQWFPEAFSVFSELFYRSYLSWNFVGPFAPMGMIPHLLVLQACSLIGLALAFFSGALLMRRKLPEWQGLSLRMVQIMLGAGIILALGAGVGGAVGIRSRIAPFEPPEFSRPYIWTRDGVLIFFPGDYAMVRLAHGSPLPKWVQKLSEGKAFYRLEQHYGFIALFFPPDSSYPAELQGLVDSLNPLLARSEIWRKPSQVIVAPPTSEIDFEDSPNGVFVVSFEALTELAMASPVWQDLCAWALTSSSGLENLERVYLALYLLESINKKRVGEYLKVLRLKATGKPADDGYFYYSLLWQTGWGPKEASLVLNYWEQGEKIGHENYIRMFLEGAKR